MLFFFREIATFCLALSAMIELILKCGSHMVIWVLWICLLQRDKMLLTGGSCGLSYINNFEFNMNFNTLRPRQNGRHFPDDIFKCIFLNENAWIPIKISLKFVPKGPINKIPSLVQITAWRRSGDKPLSEPMMVSLPTHICVTRPQWVKRMYGIYHMMLYGAII